MENENGYVRHARSTERLRKVTGPMSKEEFDENHKLYIQLRERIKQLRMSELFDEPSTYEDELDED